MHTLNFHALSGIRTHYLGFRAREDSVCPRPLSYRDWLKVVVQIGKNRPLLTITALEFTKNNCIYLLTKLEIHIISEQDAHVMLYLEIQRCVIITDA
jgi:hypothetical protein